MARYIHCGKCNNKMKDSASKFGELYESIEGTALRDMFCDGTCYTGESPTQIKKGEKCFAAVLLNNNQHPNYQSHHPSSWASQYINLNLIKHGN